MKTYFTFISVLILCVLSISSCQQPKEIKISDILSETIKVIDSTHSYFLYHVKAPKEQLKDFEPRMHLVFCNDFYEDNEEIQLAFEALMKVEHDSYQWAYFDNHIIPDMNYDKMRTYHYVDCDTLKSHFY